MRLLLLIVLVNGLVPALGDAIGEVVQRDRAEQVSPCRHAGAPCDAGRERGCSGSEHHCLCCPGMPALARQDEGPAAQPEAASDVPPAVVGVANTRSLEPPHRPPIV